VPAARGPRRLTLLHVLCLLGVSLFHLLRLLRVPLLHLLFLTVVEILFGRLLVFFVLLLLQLLVLLILLGRQFVLLLLVLLILIGVPGVRGRGLVRIYLVSVSGIAVGRRCRGRIAAFRSLVLSSGFARSHRFVLEIAWA